MPDSPTIQAPPRPSPDFGEQLGYTVFLKLADHQVELLEMKHKHPDNEEIKEILQHAMSAVKDFCCELGNFHLT
jgi:hypothetical protein